MRFKNDHVAVFQQMIHIPFWMYDSAKWFINELWHSITDTSWKWEILNLLTLFMPKGWWVRHRPIHFSARLLKCCNVKKVTIHTKKWKLNEILLACDLFCNTWFRSKDKKLRDYRRTEDMNPIVWTTVGRFENFESLKPGYISGYH